MEHLKKTYPRRKKPSLERIAAGIYEDNNTPVKYAYYTDAKIKLWRENHSKDWFEMKGAWDKKRQEHGFTTHNGGLYRTMYRAAMKYAKDGTTSYVNCFTGIVSKGSTLEDQRLSCIAEYVRLRVNYAVVYGTNPCFLRLNGFFPQAWGKDKWKEFIKIDMKKIEKRIAKEIKLRTAGTPVDPLQEKVNVKLAKAI